MNVTVQLQSTPVLDFMTVASVLGIDCPDGLPGGTNLKDSPGIEWSFPGANALTESQLAGLDLLTEYMVTGQERYPGLIQHVIDAGNFVTGKRNFLKSQIDAPDKSSPIQAIIQLLVTMNSGGIANVPAAKASAKALIDAGAAD